MREYWVETKNYPRYWISNLGNIYDTVRERIVAQSKDSGGYRRVKLNTNRGRVSLSVHRLVASTFFDYDITYSEINHFDGDKSNNAIWNLEICNRSENMLHAFKNNLAKPVHKPFRVKINELDLIFESTGQVDRYLGVSSGSVSKTLRGLQPTCKGFTFSKVY